MLLAPARPRTRAPTFGPDVLVTALIIIFPVIGLEQIWHTTPVVLRTLPLYEALHWLSDALLAVPLGAAAVWGGNYLATRLRIGAVHLSDLFARACVIALLLAVLMVPGEALHQQADVLTHTHAVLGFHPHVGFAAPPTDGPRAIVDQALHALSDGLAGQILGLPLAFAALVGARRRPR